MDETRELERVWVGAGEGSRAGRPSTTMAFELEVAEGALEIMGCQELSLRVCRTIDH